LTLLYELILEYNAVSSLISGDALLSSMATETITLSDLAALHETRPKPAIQDVSTHSQDHVHPGFTLRTNNDPQITSIRHDGNAATPSNAHSIDDQTSRLPFGRLMLVYACLATAYFTSTLDINAVATALHVIGTSLNAGTTITWAGTAYLMGQAACQPLYGRLSDVFGRKPILMLSLLFIVIGGTLCGFAQTPTWLYICRALSGVGGGGVSSVVQIVVSDLVSMRDRGKYQGLLSAAIGLGSCTGPFIAAEMLRRGGEAWRWIFWVPPMMASGCLVCMWFLLPLRPVTGSWKEKVRKIDWFGLVVAVVAMVFLLVSWFRACFYGEPGVIATDDFHSYLSIPADRCGPGTAPW
jgi:predicted MFS family arabinose efflux permease